MNLSKKAAMHTTVLIAAILILASSSFAQTNWDEYNYATKGYKDVLEKGLTGKAGYKVTEISKQTVTYGADKRNISVRSLQQSGGTIKAYIVIYQLRDEARQYYCIPHPSSIQAIRDAYLQSLPADGKSINQLQAITYAISMGLKWQ